MNETKPIATMPDQKNCPQCGAALPTGALEGLCPACLLQQGVAGDTATQPPMPPFEPPTLSEVARLFPQLEILEFIGKGGMGAVYKARQPSLDRFVALKILPAQTDSGPAFAERFNREARALARLGHPNIVGVYDFGQADGWHYFLMEFVDGVNLRQLQRSGRLSPREALQIVPQICDALQYAHDEGVVHRDIKPENVLVDRKGRVKIADFGLAKILGHDAPDRHLTGEGQVMGTPHYMAPEQVEHPLEVDHRADIYSLGVVFYEMLTGELPLGRFAPPSRKVRVDVRLDEVVLHALEKEPEQRYQHASQVKTAVETIAQTSAARPAPSAAESETGVPLFAHSFGLTFRSPMALKLARIGWVVGCLAALGFLPVPIPGWKGIFGLSGFFGLIGVAVLIENFHHRRSANDRRGRGNGCEPGVPAKGTGVALGADAGGRRRGSWLLRSLGIATILAFVGLCLRVFVLVPFEVVTDAVTPEIPRGSHVIVFKLARHFAANDIVAYRANGKNLVGRVTVAGPSDGKVQITRGNNPAEDISARDIVGRVIVNTRTGVTVDLGAAASPPAPTKTIVLTRATNLLVGESRDLRTVMVSSGTYLQPGEALRGRVKTQEGEVQDAAGGLSVQCEQGRVSTSSVFIWMFTGAFGEKEAEAAIAQIEADKTERPITLTSHQPLELFSVTNRFGGVMVGYVEFVRTDPLPVKIADGAAVNVRAMVRIKQFNGYFPSVEYSAEVPPGYALRATGTDGQVSTHTSAGSKQYHSTWFQPFRSSSSQILRQPNQRLLQQAAFQAHLQELQNQGPLEVVLDEPRLLFSITNSPVDVFHGFLELVGPNPDANKRSGAAAVDLGAATSPSARAKTIVLTRATNQVIGDSRETRTVMVWSDNALQPGEALRARVKTQEGEMQDAGSQLFVRCGQDSVHMSSAFTWFLSGAFGEKEADAAVAQMQENKTERPITLTSHKPVELFSITNRFGGVVVGYAEFVRTDPLPVKIADGAAVKVRAMVRIKQFYGYYPSVEYSAEVPPGYALRATATDGEASTHTSADTYQYRSTWSQPFRSSPPQILRQPNQMLTQQTAFQAHLQELQDQGPLEVVLGEPRLLFSITNSPVDVFSGFLELVGPSSDATK